MNSVAILFTAMGALGALGGLGSLFYVRQTGAKLRAEALKIGVEADVALSGQALEWVRETRQMAVDADSKAQRCSDELEALRDHVTDVLEPMMRNAGLKVPPFIWKRVSQSERTL